MNINKCKQGEYSRCVIILVGIIYSIHKRGNLMSIVIPNTTIIDGNVSIKENVHIGQDCVIQGSSVLENVTIGDRVHIVDSKIKNCTIGDDVKIEDYSVISDTVVDKNTTIIQSHITESEIGPSCTIGPFAHLRPKSKLKGYNKIGAFVQLKNSALDQYTSASHLAYIGDATVGKYVNIGCGVVFVNYDGMQKYHTSVGDYCFVGCHTNLIAPIEIGNHCFIAAGATLTKDIPANSFVIGRSTPTIKTNTKYNHEE